MTARISLLLVLLSSGAFGHAISMSTGFATIKGNQVEYMLRMPAYEIGHLKDPEHILFQHIRFTSGFETGQLIGQECHLDAPSGNFVCAANYEFRNPVDRLGVECTFFEITVPNHIHMLHAERAGKSDQAILDSSFTSAKLGFRPPTAAELAMEQSGAGATRVWTNGVQLLLLIALALAARSFAELCWTGLAFVAGESAGTAALLRSGWQPSPRFTEAAAALALAYLALEILAFPKSRGRWVLALIFGGFSGMYFSVFIAESGFLAAWVLAGAAFAGLAVLALAGLIGFVFSKAPLGPGPRLLLSRAAAAILLATGSYWFYLRLRG